MMSYYACSKCKKTVEYKDLADKTKYICKECERKKNG